MASKKAGVNLPSAIRRALPWLTARLVDSDQPEAAIPELPVPATPPPPPSNAGDLLAQAVTHLAYLGYEVGPPDADGWSFARHPSRYDFHIRSSEWGLRLCCLVTLRGGPGGSRKEWLDYLNTANEQGRIAQFSLFKDSAGAPVVRMRAIITGAYSQPVFALMIDLWHDDLDLIRRKPAFPPSEDTVDIRATSGTIH